MRFLPLLYGPFSFSCLKNDLASCRSGNVCEITRSTASAWDKGRGCVSHSSAPYFGCMVLCEERLFVKGGSAVIPVGRCKWCLISAVSFYLRGFVVWISAWKYVFVTGGRSKKMYSSFSWVLTLHSWCLFISGSRWMFPGYNGNELITGAVEKIKSIDVSERWTVLVGVWSIRSMKGLRIQTKSWTRGTEGLRLVRKRSQNGL